MEEEYLIEEVFLETDAPDSAEIEIEESGFANFIIQSENTNIEAEMIISGIDGGNEPTIEEYMVITDNMCFYTEKIDEKFRAKNYILATEQLYNQLTAIEGVK